MFLKTFFMTDSFYLFIFAQNSIGKHKDRVQNGFFNAAVKTTTKWRFSRYFGVFVGCSSKLLIFRQFVVVFWPNYFILVLIKKKIVQNCQMRAYDEA